MTPTELFEEARLTEALAAQRLVVAEQSDNIAEQLLLCDLEMFAGERDAVRQILAGLANHPSELGEYLAEWRQLLDADAARHSNSSPYWLIANPGHESLRARALRDSAGDAALDLIESADEQCPWIEGYVDGRSFEGGRDVDDVLGPMLEVFMDGKWHWLPIERVRKLRIEEAHCIRDQLYRPIEIWLDDGRTIEAFMPALYAHSANHAEDGIRIGAGVDWIEQAGLLRGVGARTFLFGEEELSLDEFRQIEVRHVT